MLKQLTGCLLLVGLAAASSSETGDADLSYLGGGAGDFEEDRSLFTSEGSYYVALNTTYVVLGTLLVGAILLATFLVSSFGGDSASGNLQQPIFSRGDGGFNDHYGHHGYHGQRLRNKRHAFDTSLNNQVALLEQAFNKYQVTEAGCKLYVACESSKDNTIQKSGKLTKLVSQALSTIDASKNEDLLKDDIHMKDLLAAYRIGSIGSDCSTFRKECRKVKL